MKIQTKKITELKEYENNPRKNDDAVAAVAASIREFGFRVPVVLDKDRVIIAGHTRVKAAKQLGMDEVPCVIADDLSPEQVKAFRLADNKTAELAGWDMSKLDEELAGIFDIDMFQFGFEEKEDVEEVPGEVQFTEELLERHNYIVLFFDNEVDWLQAQSVFDLKQVAALSTRKDGKISKGNKRMGVGRVINGAEALERLLRG